MLSEGERQSGGDVALSGPVAALRDALPGIHAWFNGDEQVNAAAAVLIVGLADLREDVAKLRRDAAAQVDEAAGDVLRESLALGMRAAFDDVIALIDADFVGTKNPG